MVAFLAFALYFLTGAACIVVGSSLSHLVKMYGIALDKVVLLGSAYALGRVLTVYFTGRWWKSLDQIKVLAVGTVLIGAFLIGIPTVPVYYAGLAFAFLGGAGMGTQDTVCPVLLSMAFHDTYAGAMSAGQAFFWPWQFHYTVPRWNYAVGKTTILLFLLYSDDCACGYALLYSICKKEIQEQNRKEKRNRNNK